MRRFVLGALIGAGLMYVYIHQTDVWRSWATDEASGIGSEYRHDSMKKKADEILK